MNLDPREMDKESWEEWIENHWNKLNKRVGACPTCNQMNEDKSRLALRAAETGGSGPLAPVKFLQTLADWPEPLLDKRAIQDYNPLTVQCKHCGTDYEPERLR